MVCAKGRRGWIWSLVLRWPIRRRHQMIFAEAFAQALASGVEISEALSIVAKVVPSFRFRHALVEMRTSIRSGYSLESSLTKTGIRVDESLRAALQVGEQCGCLVDELIAFARGIDRASKRILREALGRKPEAACFASTLARLLRERSMTLDVIEAAGRIAGARSKSFQRVVKDILREMENGCLFSESLQRHRDYFDEFYCSLIEMANTREQVRCALKCLGQ